MRTSPGGRATVGLASPRFAAVLVAVGLVLAALRVLAIFTENVNWDEFALLQRAVLTARTGEIVGGGRPGLGTLVLVPFALECRNAVDALVQARVLWTGMVAASAVTFWYLVRAVLPPSRHRWLAVATGLGLWVLSPPVLGFSTQVRTDQPAILFGLLGGLALVASRRRPALALLAGVLFATGFLFTQKLAYVALLAGVLAAGHHLVRGEWQPRREALRAMLTAIASLAVVLGYHQAMQGLAGAPAVVPMSGGLQAFEFYREAIGWRLYLDRLPLMVPQVLAVGVLLMVTLARLRRDGSPTPELMVGLAVVTAGTAVALFHAGRFPYFLMVLGLFPAVAGALVLSVEMDRVTTVRARAGLLALFWVPLLFLAVLRSAAFLVDTQAHQRVSLAFVERNFPPHAAGFHNHGAFACRQDPEPFPVRFAQIVVREFYGPEGPERAEAFMEEFRRRPVAFMIRPLAGEPFPGEVRDFWQTRYVHYHGTVHVPGREVRGAPGWTGRFEVVVPGDYAWRPVGPARPLDVDGSRVDPGSTIRLEGAGYRRLSLPDGGAGLFVLALPEPPDPDPRPFFRSF